MDVGTARSSEIGVHRRNIAVKSCRAIVIWTAKEKKNPATQNLRKRNNEMGGIWAKMVSDLKKKGSKVLGLLNKHPREEKEKGENKRTTVKATRRRKKRNVQISSRRNEKA